MLTASEKFVRLCSLDDRKSGHKYTQGPLDTRPQGRSLPSQARKGHDFPRWGIGGSDMTAAASSEPPSRARRQLGALIAPDRQHEIGCTDLPPFPPFPHGCHVLLDF